MRVAREGLPIVGAMLVATALCATAAWLASAVAGAVIAGAGLILTGWGVWFFRDPERRVPAGGAGGVGGAGMDEFISPADGRVIKIDRAALPKEIGSDHAGEVFQRVAIFLNLFDVHVNRVPATGRILRVAYVPGRFFNASLDKASAHNERSAALMIDDRGRRIGFVQIAGLVAWRIVNHLREGQRVTIGERFGLIRFGSRAEVYFPEGVEVAVKVGDRVRAGESVLARAAVPAGGRETAAAAVGAGAGA